MSTEVESGGPSGRSIVAHVVVVGFHAQLGNRIEFAYPRLRGDPILRSPKVTDTTDISYDGATPTLSSRQVFREDRFLYSSSSLPPQMPVAQSSGLSTSSSSSSLPMTSATGKETTSVQKDMTTEAGTLIKAPSSHHWGQLPDEWAFLPFMALPDGAHDQSQDVVFFTLPPDVHCVACFRQTQARDAKSHAAGGGGTYSYERSVASRGSVQKSVVLLCRRPLFGVLADRLVPAVRAYFDQADFADTHVLASLFHALNVSLARPSLSTCDTLFHGLDLRALVRRLGPQLGAIIKLVLLERRVVFYSQPVRFASNAVVALASIFSGALDSIAPKLQPLDTHPADVACGLPLSLFGSKDRVVLQPYAPLPLLSDIIPNERHNGCIVGTSHNVGLLLSSTASAHARKVASTRRASAVTKSPNLSLDSARAELKLSPEQSSNGPTSGATRSQPVLSTLSPVPPRSQPTNHSSPPKLQLRSNDSTASLPARLIPPSSSSALPGTPSKTRKHAGGVPVVDALVNWSTGRVAVSASLEPFCRVTELERNFFRDLVAAASQSAASVSSSGATGPFVGSDDYLRSRLRTYITRFLQSISSIDGVLGGPFGGETWSDEMLDEFDFSPLNVYNPTFVRKWMTTRNAAEWARRCEQRTRTAVGPPRPEVDLSLLQNPIVSVDRVTEGFRRNVADLGKFSSFLSSKAAEGFAGLFKRIEQEVAKMDTAVDEANSNHNSPPVTNNTSSTVNSKKRDIQNGAPR